MLYISLRSSQIMSALHLISASEVDNDAPMGQSREADQTNTTLLEKLRNSGLSIPFLRNGQKRLQNEISVPLVS